MDKTLEYEYCRLDRTSLLSASHWLDLISVDGILEICLKWDGCNHITNTMTGKYHHIDDLPQVISVLRRFERSKLTDILEEADNIALAHFGEENYMTWIGEQQEWHKQLAAPNVSHIGKVVGAIQSAVFPLEPEFVGLFGHIVDVRMDNWNKEFLVETPKGVKFWGSSRTLVVIE